MFQPRYTITDKLLANIKKINTLVIELNHRHFSHTVLVEFEREARAISAFASTSIEGNPLPLTDVKHILKSKPENVRASEREVLNYNQALEHLNRSLKKQPLDLERKLILYIHRQVLGGLMPDFVCGKLRQSPVFVNNPKTGVTVYLPPDQKDVSKLVDELTTFIKKARGSVDPLILAGIFHKQFVIIHPFLDGNGRTTRLLTKVLLADMGIDTFHLFSFENYYNRNVTNYFHHVGVQGNYYELVAMIDFTPWLEYFTDGIIDELLRVQKELVRVVSTPRTELKPHYQQIFDFIEEKGSISDRDYARLTRRAKATRTLDFKTLIAHGSIERKGKGRATYYQLKRE